MVHSRLLPALAALATSCLLAACGPGTTTVDATPPRTTVDPVGGLFDAAVTVTLNCDDGGGDGCVATYYSLDGSTPSASSATYTDSLVFDATTVLAFFSVDAAGNAEAVQSHTYLVELPPPADVDAPVTTVTPAGGIFAHALAVALVCDDGTGSGCASIRYTLDGTDPDAASAPYAGPLTLEADTTLKFLSIDLAGNAESFQTEDYVIDLLAPTTTATPAGGLFASTQSVVLACDDGAGSGCGDTYYTLDGTDPDTGSTVYSMPIDIAADTTLKFFSVDLAGNAGGAEALDFRVDTGSPTTTPSLGGGLFASTQTVTLACDDGAGVGCAAIYYTLDGTMPDLSSPLYSGAISVSADTLLSFFSVDLVGNQETPQVETYSFDYQAPITTPSVPAGLYSSSFALSLSCDDGAGSGCTNTYYTLDGSLPTVASLTFSGPLTLTADTTLRTFSVDLAGNAEAVRTEAYRIDAVPPTVAASPVGGLYGNAILMVLTCADGAGSGCAGIFYTTDGSEPLPTSPPYTGPFTLSSDTELGVLAVDAAGNQSSPGVESYTFDTTPPSTVATPTGGEYAAAQTVSLSCTDPNGCAAIHYTTDGSLPTAASTVYSTPLGIPADTTLRFFSIDTAGNAEGVLTESYVIDEVAPTLTASPLGGLFANQIWVTLSCDDGAGSGCAAIHHTTDGSAPTVASPINLGPVVLSADTTLRALAVDRVGNQSAPLSEGYTFDGTAPATTATPAGGRHASTQSVSLACTDANGCAGTYFTTDGSLPTVASPVYATPLNIAADTTLRFFSVDTAGNPEGVVTEVYVIDLVAPTVTIAPAGGLFGSQIWATLSCDDGTGSGCAAIHFTTDGSVPTTASPVVTGPVLLSGDTTLRALGVDLVGNLGPVATEVYTFDTTAPVTTAGPAGGIFAAPANVTLSCTDTNGCGSTYFTTDGSLPTTASVIFTTPLNFTADTTLRFFSVDSVGNHESVVTEVYGVDETAPTVTLSPLSGDYSAGLWVVLSCDDGTGSGCAAIHSTLDGSAPTLASPIYSVPFFLDADTTVRAFAVDLAGNQSPERSEAYLFDYQAPSTLAAPAGGLYTSAQSVTLTCDDATGSGCDTIHYTTDGSLPTTASAIYPAALALSTDTTLRFLSVDQAGNVGPVVTEVYTFDFVSPTVSATPVAGLYNTAQSISLSCDDGGGSGCTDIHYTINGSAATTASPVYTVPFTRSINTVVRFMAVDVAGNSSTEASALYTFDLVDPTTTASPVGGLYNSAQTVALTCNDGAGSGCNALHYTTDGSDPTTASPTYAAPIAIASTTTLMFRSIDVAGNLEVIRTEIYTIDTVAPGVVTSFPADGATGVILNPIITLTFDEPLEPTTVNGSNFSVDNGVTGNVSYDAATNTLIFTPDNPLVYGTLYTASNTAGIADLAGNGATPGAFSFTTMAPPDLLSGISTAQFSVRGLALDDSGNGVVMWVSKSGSGWRLLYAYYDSSAGAFLPEVEVYSTPNTSNENWTLSGEYTSYVGASLAASNGTTFRLVYPVGRDLMTRDVTGGVLGAEQTISTGNNGNAYEANIIASGSQYLATFKEDQFADERVHAIIHDGTSWGTDTIVENLPNNVDRPVAAGYGGGWAVAWRNWYSSTHEIWVARHDGTAWQTEEQLGTGLVPQIASNGSGYAVSYLDGTDAYATFFDGTSWSAATTFDGLGENIRGLVHLSSDGSGYLASYATQIITPSEWKLYGQRYVSGAWTPAVQLISDAATLTVHDVAPGPAAGEYVMAFRIREIDHPYQDVYGLRAIDFDGSTWGAPVEVEADPAHVSQVLLSTRGGATIAAFAQPLGDTARMRTRGFDGTSWNLIEEAASSIHLGAAYRPSVLGNGGASVAVWTAQGASGLLTVFAAHHDGTGWSVPVMLSDPSYYGRTPKIASDGSGFMVCYEEYPRGIAVREFDGTSWLARVQLSASTSTASNCDIASDGSRYAVSWNRWTGGLDNAYVSVRTGGVWSTPAAVDSVGDDTQPPAIASNGTGFMMAWVQEVFAVDSVYAAEYAFDGSTWSWGPPSPLESSNSAAQPKIDIVSNGNGYVAIWSQYESGFNLRPWAAVHDGLGWTTGSPISLTHRIGTSYPPAIAPMGSDYVVAWRDGTGLFASHRTGAAWQTPVQVATGTQDPPAIHASAGEARVSFPAWDGAGYSLFTSSYDGTIWGPWNLIEGDSTRVFSSGVGHDGTDWSIVWAQVDGTDALVRDIQGRVGF